MSAVNVGSIRATIPAALAVYMLAVGSAHAQFFWPQSGPWWGWGPHAPSRHHHQPRRAQPDLAKKVEPRETTKGPLQIVISIADQRISVYDDGALIARSAVSTGVPGHPTPRGVFSVIGKQVWHRSNLYSAAPMPYMQRITWSGIALHAGVLPGYPASHGCIRLKDEFAIRLYRLTRRGTRVIIAPDDTGPAEIANPRLFVPNPASASGPPEPRAASMDSAVLAAAAVRPASTPDAESQQAGDHQEPDAAPAAAAPRKVVPITVFVSRKAGKLFVRQGYTPLFDAPVTIQNPEQPLGTHVFTVMALQNDDAAARWTVVSVPEGSPPPPQEPTKRRKLPAKQVPQVWSPERANAALDRIEMPQDAVERISALLTPGSSLIVSDYGISGETGKDTDFIVLTR